MAEKKYFWLKMPRNFFEKHYIKIRSDKFSRDPELKVENFKIKKAPCIPAKRFLVLLFF